MPTIARIRTARMILDVFGFMLFNLFSIIKDRFYILHEGYKTRKFLFPKQDNDRIDGRAGRVLSLAPGYIPSRGRSRREFGYILVRKKLKIFLLWQRYLQGTQLWK